jgi:hypothetical protein
LSILSFVDKSSRGGDMPNGLSRAERGLLTAVRVLISLSFAVLVFFGPIVLGVTVYAAIVGYPGAALTGVAVPVGVDVALPAGTGPAMSGSDGLALVPTSVPVGSLPVPWAVAAAVLYAVPLGLTLLALNRLTRLSWTLTGSDRFGGDVPRDVRTLAVWVLGAGASYSVVATAGSFVAAGVVADPRVHTDIAAGPLMFGAGLAALLTVVSAVVRSGAALQTDHDLTV